ncbi:MAG TPA: hypothetical protein VGA75_00430, partial [Paracoccaceae bacterium]
MAEFTTIAAFRDLTEPERKLIAACRAGKPCILGDGTRPEAPSPQCTIRADLLRLLILGGSKDCGLHDHGVALGGAYVTGSLRLDFATAKGQTLLCDSAFTDEISAHQARLNLFSLEGSKLPGGLVAQGAEVTGDVFLRNGFHATGEVSVHGAKIGGQLNCEGAHFDNPNGDALVAQGLRVDQGFIWQEVTVDNGNLRFGSAHVGDLS